MSEPFARRSFLTQVGTGISIIGGSAFAWTPAAAAQSSTDARWQPARHQEDQWFDQIPGQHRFVFDTTNEPGLSNALLYAGNYFTANASGYGLKDSDLAVVIVARHTSTPFAYTDAIWEKYGAPISKFTSVVDPATKEAPKANLHMRQLQRLIDRGVHLAVCQMATRAIAGSIAGAVSGNADDIFNELSANLLPHSHLVPAGIVAVNRAQEYGYSFVLAV